MALIDQPTVAAPRTWADLLLPHFPGAPAGLVEHTLLNVLRDFCREGSIWQAEAAPLAVLPGVDQFQVVPVLESVDVGFVLYLRDDKGRYWAPADAASSWVLKGQQCHAMFSCPTQYDVVALDPSSLEGATTLTPYISMVPRTTEVPDWFRARHELAVTRGVQAEMWALPNKSWSNRSSAQAAAADYLQRRTSARGRARRGNVNSTMPWRFPRGW